MHPPPLEGGLVGGFHEGSVGHQLKLIVLQKHRVERHFEHLVYFIIVHYEQVEMILFGETDTHLD